MKNKLLSTGLAVAVITLSTSVNALALESTPNNLKNDFN